MAEGLIVFSEDTKTRERSNKDCSIFIYTKQIIVNLYKKADPHNMRIRDIYEVMRSFTALQEADILFPEKKWFANPEFAHSIHGIAHIVRVCIYIHMFGQYFNLTEREMKVTLLSGLTHDLRRKTQIPEQEHGEEAAKWFEKSEDAFVLRRELSKEEMMAVMILNHYHNVSWKNIPQEIINNYNRLFKVLKYADAVDRYRDMNENLWPSMNYFMIESFEDETFFEKMFYFARYFTTRSLYEQYK